MIRVITANTFHSKREQHRRRHDTRNEIEKSEIENCASFSRSHLLAIADRFSRLELICKRD
jgi:hypothetical protein